ncbi:hypothetical protein XENOCAPTIV_022619 [Xenoophorus captivus]|uniref:Uncharacterized protein n=1 Tax=Xenoophorus captivus TaxID=1517983 RepID=A0ABV0SBA3_9TELE
MLEVDQRVKLQFELNDTLQTVDVLRGELTEVGNRLEAIEGNHATPPPWRNGGTNRNPPHRLKPLEVSHTCVTLREPAGQIWRMLKLLSREYLSRLTGFPIHPPRQEQV